MFSRRDYSFQIKNKNRNYFKRQKLSSTATTYFEVRVGFTCFFFQRRNLQKLTLKILMQKKESLSEATTARERER